jgi:hypothetical protein
MSWTRKLFAAPTLTAVVAVTGVTAAEAHPRDRTKVTELPALGKLRRWPNRPRQFLISKQIRASQRFNTLINKSSSVDRSLATA